MVPLPNSTHGRNYRLHNSQRHASLLASFNGLSVALSYIKLSKVWAQPLIKNHFTRKAQTTTRRGRHCVLCCQRERQTTGRYRGDSVLLGHGIADEAAPQTQKKQIQVRRRPQATWTIDR